MSNVISLAADVRERAGKGAARATRRAGRVPAVIYGNKQDPLMISLDPIEFNRHLTTGFFTFVYALDVAGETHKVLARDLQLDPVTDKPIHVDFMRFSASTRINVEVQVIFDNEEACPGIKRGGVLNIVRHTVELISAPDTIPEAIHVDLTGLEVGDSIHIGSIELPEGVAPAITDRDFTVATIAAPTVTVDEDALEAEEAAEGEAAERAEDAAEGADDDATGGSDGEG